MTWLPGRLLTRNEAITAMTIAETVGDVLGNEPRPSARLWPHVEGWAAELGIDPVEAVTIACRTVDAQSARAAETRIERLLSQFASSHALSTRAAAAVLASSPTVATPSAVSRLP